MAKLEHIASVRPADDRRYATYRRTEDEFGDGIDVLYGIRKGEGPRGGKTEVVSLYFNPSRFTLSEVRDWLDEYEYEADVEPAGRENPAVSPFDDIQFSMYPAFARDTDEDDIPDVDDPHPLEAGDLETVEEVELSDELRKLLDVRADFQDVLDEVLRDLRGLHQNAISVEGRVKSPYSMINKLRRKRLIEPFIKITPDMVGDVLTRGLTDVAGTRIILPGYHQVATVVRRIKDGVIGEVVEHENHYQTEGGYRAHHFIILRGGYPVEVQVKTRRMAKIADAAHLYYKAGTLDHEEMNRLTELAHQADLGNDEAAAEIDAIIEKEALLEEHLYEPRKNPASAGSFAKVLAGGLGLLFGVRALRNSNSSWTNAE